MSKLPLTFACGQYDRMVPLSTGDVQPEGIDLNYITINNPRQIFDRLTGALEFDLAEFSISEFITRMSAGDSTFVAIPIFATRAFRHRHITVNRRAGIKTPKDLEGKRVGVALYTMTAAVFIRGLLQHEYGVDLSKIHWVQGALNVPGRHGSPSVVPLLKPVPIEINDSGKSLGTLLAEGTIDAIAGAALPVAMRTTSEIQPLFPNYHEVEKQYYRQTRIFPIMHLVVIRRDVYEKHPFIATSLYKAMSKSKDLALAEVRERWTDKYMLPWLGTNIAEIDDVFGGDPWPYGVEANRPTLEALVTYLSEQHMIAASIPIERLFVPLPGIDTQLGGLETI